MSTTTSKESDHNPARRRRWSKERDPPTMRIILLGKDVSTNSRVGNFILGRSAFDSEAPPDDHQIERVRGKDMMIINCPHLLQLNLSYHQIIQTVRECVDLSHPGPHLILLIFKHDECSREDQEHVEMILKSFSDSVYQHTLVLTTHDSHSLHQTDINDNIKKIIKKCFSRHYRLEGNSSPADLKETFRDIIKSNNGSYLICDEYGDAQRFTMKQQADEREKVIEEIKREKEEINRRETQRERKVIEEKDWEEMKKQHEQRIKEMKKKYEDEARKQAEEFNEFKERKERHVQELKEILEEREKKQELLEQLCQHLEQRNLENIREIEKQIRRREKNPECVIQ